MEYLLHGNSYIDQNLFYASGYLGSVATYVSAEDGVLLVPEMDTSRASDESSASRVVSLDELGYEDRAVDRGKHRAYADCVSDLLEQLGLDSVTVAPSLPAFLFEGLGSSRVEIDEDLLSDDRRHKSVDEVHSIRKAVEAAEASIRRVADLLRSGERAGESLHVAGEPLTASRIKKEVDHSLVNHGCVAEEVIAAPGKNSYKPHWRGKGRLRTGEPLVLDVFPRRREERFCGDVSRTFLVGKESRVEEMHGAIIDALEAAEGVGGPGVDCSEIHAVAEETLEESGFESPGDEGFVHSVGHGIGLDVHEGPRLSAKSQDVLREGDVVTLEPGLYYEEVGGVRVEDVYAVVREGVERLSTIDRGLEP